MKVQRLLEGFSFEKRSTFGLCVDEFENLPTRAKEIYFYAMEKTVHQNNIIVHLITNPPFAGSEDCQSPIEKILYVACKIVFCIRNSELKDGELGIFILPQVDIETDSKKYRADFSFVLEKEEGISPEVIVECDGHEFHQKTKTQVEHDNQREYDIKKMGYDILRFSGSQIYNNPFKCANDIFDYLIAKDGRV